MNVTSIKTGYYDVINAEKDHTPIFSFLLIFFPPLSHFDWTIYLLILLSKLHEDQQYKFSRTSAT